jgi:hypothetical protein
VQVRAYSAEVGHTLYVMDSSGKPPDPARVQAACQASGGRLVTTGLEGGGLSAGGSGGGMAPTPTGVSPSAAAAGAVAAAAAKQGGAGAAFYYAFLQRNWEGSPSSLNSM